MIQPSPPGRRSRKPAAERRAIPRSTALNQREAELVDIAAQIQGISVSRFLRQAALDAAHKASSKQVNDDD